MFLGIDVGTSSVKAVIVDEHDAVVAQASAPLAVNRPQPLYSEQDPEAWWQATVNAIGALPSSLRGRVQAMDHSATGS